jgi:hypothetical protein
MSSRSTRTVGVGIVVALALSVAQVALAEVPIARFTAADQAAARAAVLTIADFEPGGGWKGGLLKNAKPFTGTDCPGLFEPKQSDLVITGVAKSVFTAPGAEVTSGAQVYRTARMAKLDWDRTVALPAALTCMRRQAVAASTPGFRLVSLKRAPFPRIGERVFRIRSIVDYTPKGGKTVRLLFDHVAFGRGRTGISLSFTIPYAYRAAADATEINLARSLISRIRV